MSDREQYRSVVPTFWTDPEVKRPLSRDAKLLLLYWFTSPHGNMIGLYNCPLEYAAAETGIPIAEVRALTFGPLAPFVWYDETTEEVLALKAARHQLRSLTAATEEKKGDNRRKAVLRHLEAAHSPTLVRKFLTVYAAWNLGKPLPDAPDAPPKPLHSPLEGARVTGAVQEQEQEQDSSTATQSAGAAQDDYTDGQLLAHERATLWKPDGKPPADWSEGRSITVYREQRALGATGLELMAVIDGLAECWRRRDPEWLYKRGKPCIRAINHTGSGVRPMWDIALEVGRGLERGPPKGKKGQPTAISDVIQLKHTG